MLVGIVLALIGAGLLVGSRLGLGRLPGDISVKRPGFSFHFPIVTSIVVSLVLTLLVNLLLRRR